MALDDALPFFAGMTFGALVCVFVLGGLLLWAFHWAGSDDKEKYL